MPKPKIAVYGIALNEAAFAEAFCRSAADADVLLIADTGSTDDTVALAELHGAEVHRITISPWRFDDARNAALALVPGDIDICIALDLDEELQPGWREEVERCWTEGITRMRYRFDWGSGIEFYSEKIHARRGYRWRHPCHERIVPDRIDEVWAQSDALLIVHRPDPLKPRAQYLPLLQMAVAEDPNCARNALYFARELSFYSCWPEAAHEARRFLDMPDATWKPERAMAMLILAKADHAAGYITGALDWARRATAEAGDTREPWCAVADYAYVLERWAECYGAAATALALTARPLLYTTDPECWGFKPHDMASFAACRLGQFSLALKHARDALALAPDDERLAGNVAVIEADLAQLPA